MLWNISSASQFYSDPCEMVQQGFVWEDILSASNSITQLMDEQRGIYEENTDN